MVAGDTDGGGRPGGRRRGPDGGGPPPPGPRSQGRCAVTAPSPLRRDDGAPPADRGPAGAPDLGAGGAAPAARAVGFGRSASTPIRKRRRAAGARPWWPSSADVPDRRRGPAGGHLPDSRAFGIPALPQPSPPTLQP